MKSSKARELFSLLCVAVGMAGCGEFAPLSCGGDALVIKPSTPVSVTVHVGDSAIATAGERYGKCDSPPDREYTWHSSDEAIAATTPVDADHVRIVGVRPGPALVTPTYRASGVMASSVNVTVVP